MSSCVALLPSSPSGYYWVTSSNGSYCDMTTGGWTTVAYLDMMDSSQACPGGLGEKMKYTSVKGDSVDCQFLGNLILPSLHQYSKVCGQVIVPQYGLGNAFGNQISIEGKYTC